MFVAPGMVEVPPLFMVGFAAEAVGYIFDVGARVTTDHSKPRRQPALGNAATSEPILLYRPGHLQRERSTTGEQVFRR